MKFTILRFDSIDSTNTEALKHARKGANEGLCVIARQQTEGRGRQGRTWTSPMDAGLYVSIVLRPLFTANKVPLITLAAAIAVFDSLTKLDLAPDIKWPNDVMVNDQKICGVLAETGDGTHGVVVVLGIGINIASRSFPVGLAKISTSIEQELGRCVAHSEIESLLLRNLDKWYRRLCDEDGSSQIINEWKKRSSYADGKHVRVTLTDSSFSGVTNGLEPNGALRVIAGDGSVNTVHAGDVERVRPDEQFD